MLEVSKSKPLPAVPAEPAKISKMLRFDPSEMKGFDTCLDLLPGSTENAKIKWLIAHYPGTVKELEETQKLYRQVKGELECLKGWVMEYQRYSRILDAVK